MDEIRTMDEDEIISYSPKMKKTTFQIMTESMLEDMIPEGETTVEIHVVPASFEKDDGTNENDLPTESKVIK